MNVIKKNNFWNRRENITHIFVDDINSQTLYHGNFSILYGNGNNKPCQYLIIRTIHFLNVGNFGVG